MWLIGCFLYQNDLFTHPDEAPLMHSPHVAHGQIMEFNNSAEELVNHQVKPEVTLTPGWFYTKDDGKDWNLLCIGSMLPT